MSTIGQLLMVKGPDVIVATPDTTVRAAVGMMSRANVGSVVVKDGESVAGIFTERDVLTRVVDPGLNPNTATLADVMSSPVQSCQLDDRVEDVQRMMADRHFRHLAIIEDGALIGLVGLRDLMGFELQRTEAELKKLRDRLGQPV